VFSSNILITHALITWIEFLITWCLVKNSIQISKRKHSVTSRFRLRSHINNSSSCTSHRDIQTLENNVWKHSRFALVFSYTVFSCLDISVKHSLSLFIYYVKMGKIHHFCNKICCQTSMFINSRIANIGKYCDVPVYSGKMSWYSVIFRHIPWYSAIFRDIPAFRVFTTPANGNHGYGN
jgi:hypothetical protein